MANTTLGIDVAVQGLRALGQLDQSIRQISKNGNTLARTAKLVTAALAAVGGTAILGQLTKIAVQVDRTQRSFQALAGGSALGRLAFAEAGQTAREFGFELEQVEEATGRLLRAGVGALELRDNLKLVGAVARTLGVDFNEAGTEVAKAFEGGIDSSKLLKDFVARQFYDIPDIAGSSGERTRQILTNLFGPNGSLSKSLIDGSNSIEASIAQLNNAYLNLQRGLGAGFFQGLKDADSQVVNDLLADIRNLEQLGKSLGSVFGTAVAVIIEIISGVNDIRKALNAIPGLGEVGIIGLLLFGKKGAAILVLLGSAVSLIKELNKSATDLANKLDKAAESNQAYSDTFQSADDSMNQNIDQFNRLNKVIKEAVVNTEDIINARMREEAEMEAQTQKAYELKRALEEIQKAGLRADYTVVFGENTRAIIEATDELYNQMDVYQMKVDLVKDVFNTFSREAAEGLYEVLIGTKSISQAMGELAQVIIKQVITGILQLAIQVFILDYIKKKFEEIRDSVKGVNRELKTQLALQAALSFFSGGFGIPGFAQGGTVAANSPIVVGEQGPELFVPNSNGRIVPNDEISGGSGYAMSGGGDNITLTFNINTIDATDFDQLLTTRQDLIIGLINRGLAERGKRSLTA